MEILAEGLLHETTAKPKRKRRTSARKPVQPMLESAPAPNDGFDDAVNHAVSGLTNDPIMTEIFRDTAMTTLQDQMGAEKNPRAVVGGDRATQQVAGSDLDDLFGESADRWASLAFAEKKGRP